MTDKPRISCIIPVFNGAAFLEESIASVLAQTERDFELILVDDGSTDATPAIIERSRAADARIRVITQRNAGIVAALNAGLAAARGEFIARMDADDISLPGRFRLQADYLAAHPDVVLVGGRAITIDAEGRPLDDGKGSLESPRQAAQPDSDLSVFPPRVATALHPLVMMRAQALRDIGGYDAAYTCAEDYDMYIRISRHGKIRNLDADVLKYRLHGGNVSMRRTETQEREAAASEIAATRLFREERRLRPLRLSPQTSEGYIELRIFRRETALRQRNYPRALRALGFILRGLPASSPAISLRLLMMWAFNNLRYGLARVAG